MNATHLFVIGLLAASTTACNFQTASGPRPQPQEQNIGCRHQVGSYERRICGANLKGPFAPETRAALERSHALVKRQCNDVVSEKKLASIYDRCLATALAARREKRTPLAASAGGRYVVESRYQDGALRIVRLKRTTKVQGHRLPKASKVGFDQDGYLVSVRLGDAAQLGPYTFKSGTSASFFGTGALRFARIFTDQKVGDYRCRASAKDPTDIYFDPKTAAISRDGYWLNGRFIKQHRCF